MNNKVSVIVPIYKVEMYLDRCVNSIVNQTYSNIEIILVDDGSPDNCPHICDEWAIKDNRIKVIHKENGGLSDARNVGLNFATGDFISFIDSDDWVSKYYVEKLLNIMIEEMCDIVECDYIVTPSSFIKETDIKYAKVYSHDVNEAMRLHLEDTMYKQIVWNKLYKRNLINELFEIGKYHEDIFWTYQIIAKCNKLCHIELPLYYYFQREDSIMGEKYSYKRLDAIEAYEQRCKFIEEKFKHLIWLAQKNFIITCMYHSQLILETKIDDFENVIRKLCYKSKLVGNQWKVNENIAIKHKLWIYLYLYFPILTSKIRNDLGVGK